MEKLKNLLFPLKEYLKIKNNENFIFDMEDEIFNICKTFSLESKNQQKNLIETIKQNCRRIVREKTGKNLLQILILREFSGYYWFNNSLCINLVDNFLFCFTSRNTIK